MLIKKKLTALITAAAVCAGLIACGNSAAGTPTPDAAAAQEEAEDPAEGLVEEAAETLEGMEPGEEGTYKIAVMIPLSGDLAFFSSYFKPSLD